jgi:hypothetical protein
MLKKEIEHFNYIFPKYGLDNLGNQKLMSLLRSSEKSFDNYLPMLLVRKCVTSEMLTESYKMAFPNVFCTRCTLILQNN